MLTKPGNEKETLNLGTWSQALSSPCSDHTAIISAFKTHCSANKNHGPSGPDSEDVGFISHGKNDSVMLTQSISKLGLYWSLLPVKKVEAASHPGVARVLDPDWLGLEIARAWKKECLTSHGAKCENPLRLPVVRPAWVVDVIDKCVVPGAQAEGEGYVALSYRAGDAAKAKLEGLSLERLRREGALESGTVEAKLPKKVRDGIALAAHLDERFLWVDTLCIDHEDRKTASEQINAMTSIYAGSNFTIISADGDRDSGIPGLKAVSEPRGMEQKVFKLGDETCIVRNTAIFTLDHGSRYHERGWTYQEFTMSPRKLILMQKEAHWQCSCSVFHEELTLGSEVDKYIDPRPKVLAAGFPDLGALENLLYNYNRRELTYDEDALAATSGLLTAFSRTFEGGFLYGLPECMFDRALGWTPMWSHTNMRRRTPSGRASEGHLGFEATDLPNWSWVGWQGLFNWQYGEAARVNDRMYRIQEVTPVTEWYTSVSPTGPRRKIKSTWFEEREKRKDTSQPLPKGWRRVLAPKFGEFREEPMLYPDGCGEYLYKHDDFPDEDCDKWYYPFEVPDIESSTPFSMPEQTRYLFCKTWKAKVWAHRPFEKDLMGEDDHRLVLRGSASGPEVGRLHLQTDEQLGLWPELESADDTGKGREVEVYAINMCVVHSKTFNEQEKRYGHPIKREERITVLWVEWEDGVAYRLACGHVEKGAWLELVEPVVVDLCLG